MRIKSTIWLFLFFSFSGFSQGEFNTWYFGTYAGMSFNSGNPVALPPNPMAQGGLAAGSSVSDSLGNILFYSDGIKIWDRNNNVMPNGFGLLGGGGKNQAALSVQSIIDKNKYFLFTVGYKSIPLLPLRGLYYSVLDMQLNVIFISSPVNPYNSLTRWSISFSSGEVSTVISDFLAVTYFILKKIGNWIIRVSRLVKPEIYTALIPVRLIRSAVTNLI